ncbi:hypothetical protein [Solibacillus sp. FSL H8-0538]|uniref:hypothetical protein n=1 Tax=Solibacillus sp. FSL H8-0538 TaxID=2921400 RepID=UPI0030F81D18
MKELGGYFGLEQLVNNEYHDDLVALNNARNAFLYLLKSKGIQKVYIPYYLCDSVSDMLNKNNYEFEYYKINTHFIPIFNKKIYDNEILYIVNYYGQLSNEKILLLKQTYKQILIDNTHAFFQRPLGGIDTIYSCRKFFGVPDGAYLSTDKKLSEELKIDVSKERMTHILGRYEGLAADFYVNFQETDKLLNDEPLKSMSKLTHNLLGAIDYENVRQIRNNNYAYLESALKVKNKLQLVIPNGAFAYPLYTENAIEIRKKLIKRNLYIPTLWPNVLESALENSIEYQYSANILPLPCDQRYEEDDMKYIVHCINEEI